MQDDVWVLGATGRIGRAVARRLLARGQATTLVGRDAGRLDAARAALPGGDAARTVVAASTPELLAAIRRERPAVVVNTVGDYAATAVPIARAGMPGGHYVDLANDLVSVPLVLDLDDEARAAGSTLVTAAGFGVLGTEAVVAALCADRPTPSEVRVDALASVAGEPGVLGEALAASIVDALVAGGRRIVDGRLVPAPLGTGSETLHLPDGGTARSALAPAGELLAAGRASGAPRVVAGSGMVPGGTAARLLLPVASRLLSVGPVRRLAVRLLGRIPTKTSPPPRPHSWGRAVVTWADGTRREGWLRAGEGMEFTVDVAAEVALRLARGEGAPGAFTPAGAFGPELAVAAHATLELG